MCYVTGAELSVSCDEIITIAAARGQTISVEAAARLHERTQGWVAGLVLLLASLAGCSPPRTWPSLNADQGVSADVPPLPQVVSVALNFAHDEANATSPKVYNLPAQINVAAWDSFERGLAGWKPMCPGDTGVWNCDLGCTGPPDSVRRIATVKTRPRMTI
jgi:hypothetical protein